jgi:hypothetical protein
MERHLQDANVYLVERPLFTRVSTINTLSEHFRVSTTILDTVIGLEKVHIPYKLVEEFYHSLPNKRQFEHHISLMKVQNI